MVAPASSAIRLQTPSLHPPRQTGLTIAIVLVTVLVFAVSVQTPLGFAVWIFYLAPGLLSLFHRSPRFPLIIAAATSVLIVAGFFLSPGDVLTPRVVETNRVFGVVSAWLVGVLGWRFIRARTHVERESALRQGQTLVYDLMRGERDLDRLADNVLRCACEWLGASAGALYVGSEIAENGANLFEMRAGYAFDAGESRARRFHVGEGLVGQVARDGKLRKVTPLPEGYLCVSSGLGSAPARHLALAPMLANDSVCGVLELGFFEPPDPATEDFLGRIAETVGMTIRTVQYHARLGALLDEAKRQGAILRAQQEELRATNEELATQTRVLEESQQRMEEQHAELEQSNNQLGEQTLALEEQKTTLEERNRALSVAQQVLAERTEELSRVNRYKSDFLANMSHELRTPLNSALILARLLADNREGNLTEQQIKYLETIYSSGNDLVALIDDVLDLSKVEAGRVHLRPETFTVGALVQGLERMIRPMAEQKGLAFSCSSPEKDDEAWTDRQRVEQILKNLLSNAVKFTEKGRVELGVSLHGDAIVFAVSDTGIGIEKEHTEAIFEAFQQADSTTSRKYGGTGLGLAISRRLAQALGGSIDVKSAPGEGSTFRLCLPRRLTAERAPDTPREGLARAAKSVRPAAQEGRAAPAPAPQLFKDDRDQLDPSGRVVLVVEDDERFALAMCDLIHQLGFQCVVATAAEQGIDFARRYRPVGVVLDIMLPDRSGLVVLDMLKHTPETRHIPVHVVSVHDCERTVLEMGAVAFLRKPVDRERLVGALRAIESVSQRGTRRVLVVEDDEEQREALVQLIGEDDVEITAVPSAERALERLAASTFDCMILDLNLEEMSGYQLLEQMAAQGRASHPPVIVYTGQEITDQDEERLQRFGSSIVLKGARSPERLLDEVTLFLHRVETRLPVERKAMLQSLRSRERPLDSRTILLVDDDVRNVFALSSALEVQGARVRIARNGRESLEELARDPLVDLVLMDVMMPEMNGYEAMARIREQPRFRDLRIIAVTAKALPDDHERCLKAGANDYLAKPIDIARLLSLVRVWMPRSARWLS